MTAAMANNIGDDAPVIPAVEARIAKDMLRRGIPLLVVTIAFCTALWGWDGLASSGYATAIVCVNFALAAWLASTTARISPNLLMVSVLGGYIVRMISIGAAVILVRDQAWISWYPLCIALVVSHLGLLAVELRHISATLAFPDLKPGSIRQPSRLRSQRKNL